MLIYGKHAVLNSLNNKNRKLRQLYVTENCWAYLQGKITDPKILKSIEVHKLHPKKIDNLLNHRDAAHQGCVLEVDPLEQPTAEKVISTAKRILIADKITDPHNVGAIIRSALAFNFDAVVTDERNSPPENATILKTSVGAFESMPYVRVSSIGNFIEQIKVGDFWVLGLDGYADKKLEDFNFTNEQKLAIVVGSEGKGISPHILRSCDDTVKIEISSEVESLNASVAASITMNQYKI
jgi:23S rRNA (guanosine2251-2'-O)-methyltransferase